MKIVRTLPYIPDPPPAKREFILTEREAMALRRLIGNSNRQTRKTATTDRRGWGVSNKHLLYKPEDDTILRNIHRDLFREFSYESPYHGDDFVEENEPDAD